MSAVVEANQYIQVLPSGKPTKKYQVLAGAHWTPCKVIDPETGLEKIKDIPFGPRRPAGDIVESDVDLVRRFNRPNSIKYKLLGEEGDTWPEEMKQEKLQREAAESRYKRAIEKMNVRELLDHAQAEGIDVKGSTKKDDIVKMILAAM